MTEKKSGFKERRLSPTKVTNVKEVDFYQRALKDGVLFLLTLQCKTRKSLSMNSPGRFHSRITVTTNDLFSLYDPVIRGKMNPTFA